MKKKYKFPIEIFIILEKVQVKLWFNKNLPSNNYYLFLPNKWFWVFISILKHDVFLNFNFLIEHSIQDNYHKANKSWLQKKSRFFLFYNIYILTIKTRLLIFLIKASNSKPIFSISSFYKNANWLERESGEMYGCFFTQKNDIRKLLLNYSNIEYPLLKDFPVDGFYKVFFNIFFNQTYFYKQELVEL